MITDPLLLCLKLDAIHNLLATASSICGDDNYLSEQASKVLEVLSELEGGVKLTSNKIKHIEGLVDSTLEDLASYKHKVIHDNTVMLNELSRLLNFNDFSNNEGVYNLIEKAMKEYKESAYSVFKQFEVLYDLLFKLNTAMVESDIPDIVKKETNNVVSLIELLNRKANNDDR